MRKLTFPCLIALLSAAIVFVAFKVPIILNELAFPETQNQFLRDLDEGAYEFNRRLEAAPSEQRPRIYAERMEEVRRIYARYGKRLPDKLPESPQN